MRLSIKTIILISGVFCGLFILFPVNESLYYFEHIRSNENPPTFSEFILNEMMALIYGQRPFLTIFYGTFGAISAFIFFLFYAKLAKSLRLVQQLSEEYAKDILNVISQGEGQYVEFKSSLRWDYRQGKANKALDLPILKTIAGFMNGDGGTLLIGVDDDQNILGLQNDYNSLKKQNQDGFELTIMTLITSNFGTNFCRFVNIMFHEIDGNDICRVLVSKASKPAYLKHDSKLKLYMRTGGSTRELNVQEAVEYVNSHWQK